jgi:hypothetical protein
MIRHYGIVGPIIASLAVASAGEGNTHAAGAAILGGGVAGLLIGNGVSKRYAYSPGDVRAVSSFTWISAGIGTAAMGSGYNRSTSPGLLLIPAATTLLGTLFAQNQIKGIHLSEKQGSTLSLSCGGAALIGLGIVVMAKTESPALTIGVPSAFALITHQIILNSYRNRNLGLKIGMQQSGKERMKLFIDITPENYLIAQQPPSQQHDNVWPPPVRPIATLKLRF